MADEEVKNGAEFLSLSEKTIENPILSNYMKIFGDTLKIIGQHHLQLVRSRFIFSDPQQKFIKIMLLSLNLFTL
jgi:hypothetical protein